MTTQPPSLPDPSIAARHQAVLDELVAMGADIARAMHARVQAEVAAETPDIGRLTQLAASFERVSRGVRRGVLLARQLAEEAAMPMRTRATLRREIIRDVENELAEMPDRARAAALRAELMERMDAPDVDEELGTRQISMVIQAIRHDLGLPTRRPEYGFKRRTPAEVAVLHAVARRDRAGGAAALELRATT